MQDINGQTRDLYSYLDSGKAVILDFFEVMCGPCWRYHESHTLSNAYTQWGPSGTNQLMVFEIEGIKSSVGQIRGTEPPTNGDWTAGEPFPFIATSAPNTDAVISNYRVSYYPTVYMICRDRRIKLIGPSDTSVIHASLKQCPNLPSDSLFLDLVAVDSLNYVTCDNYIHLFLKFQNYGLKPVTSARISMNLDNTVFDTLDWNGSLNTYDLLDLDGQVIDMLTDGSHIISYMITELNGYRTGFRQDTITRRFTVLNSWQSPPFTEDFSRTSFPYDKWTIRNYYPYIETWERADLGYATTLRIPFYNIPVDITGTLFLPGLSFTLTDKPCLRFDLACTHNNSVIRKAGYDYIYLDYSTNCGKSFTNIAGISALDHLTAPDDSAYFIPSESQWTPIVIDLSKLALTDNVIIALTYSSTYGNNMYMKNFRIDNSLGINAVSPGGEMTVYPLPAREKLYVSFMETINNATLELFNSRGNSAYRMNLKNTTEVQIPLTGLLPGCYLLRVVDERWTETRKIIIE